MTRTWSAALLLAVAIAWVPAAGAAAAPTAADLGIEVEVGFGRDAAADTWNLVEVTASPPVPLSGRLEVRAPGMLGVTNADRPFEVAAGATRVVHLLLPPSEELAIAFVSDDGERTRILDGFAEAQPGARVGAFGSAPPLPSPLNTTGTDRAILGVAVDRAILDLGPRAFDALDTLSIPAGDLAALSEAHRRDLEVAIVNGLELLVHVRPGDGPLALRWDPVGTIGGEGAATWLEAADAAWPVTFAQLGLDGGESGDDGGDRAVAATVPAGNGRVTATVAAPGDGGAGDARELWSSLVQVRARSARPLQALDQGGDLNTSLFGGGPSLPSPWPFALFALAFVVVVGPANGFVLRRMGRRELAWVTVPVITAVFTVAALGATVTRDPVEVPVLRAAWWLDGVGQEQTVAAVQSPGRGTTEIGFPGSRDGLAGSPWSQTPSTFERSPDTTSVQLRMETLQLSSVIAWGVPERTPPLQVEAAVDDGILNVTVTNAADVPIEDVEVAFATSREELGTLAPGASTTRLMDDLGDGLARPRNLGGGMLLGMGGFGRDVPADPGPSAGRTLLAWDQLSGTPGAVWVTGSTTSDLGLAVPTVDGRSEGRIDDRGSFVAVGVTPVHLGGPVLPHEVTRTLLRTNAWAAWQPSPLEFEGGEDLILRYQLPGAGAGGQLRSTLDVGQDLGQGEMFSDDPWGPGCFEVTEIDDEGNAGDPVERCGDDISCPMDSRDCGGNDREITACFEDGTCQIAVRIGDLDGEPPPEAGGSGLEVYDHATSAWVPLEQAFPEGRAPLDTLVSARGEVLVRVRSGSFLDLGQRGLGVEALGTRGGAA